MPFFLAAVACGLAALLFAKIDPSKVIEAPKTFPTGSLFDLRACDSLARWH